MIELDSKKIELETNGGMNVGRKSKDVGIISNVDVDLYMSTKITNKNSNISSHIVNSNISSLIVNEDSCDSVRVVEKVSWDRVRLSREENDSKVVDNCKCLHKNNRKCLYNNNTSNNCKLYISNQNIKSSIMKSEAGAVEDNAIDVMDKSIEEENDTKVLHNRKCLIMKSEAGEESDTKVVDNRKCLHKNNRECLYKNNTFNNCKLSISDPNSKSIIMKSEASANISKALNTTKPVKTVSATNTSTNTRESKSTSVETVSATNTSTNTMKSKYTNTLKPSKVIITQTTTANTNNNIKTSNTLETSAAKVIAKFIAKRTRNTLRMPAAAVSINSNKKNDLDHEKFMRYILDVREKKTKLDICNFDKASWMLSRDNSCTLLNGANIINNNKSFHSSSFLFSLLSCLFPDSIDTTSKVMQKKKKIMSKGLEKEVESDHVSGDGLIEEKIVNSVSSKNDDAAIPLHLWLKWLNLGLRQKLTMNSWKRDISAIQEKFLLLRWRRNMTSSFWKWMREKTIKLHGKKKSNQGNVYVQEISLGIWKHLQLSTTLLSFSSLLSLTHPCNSCY